MPRKYPRESWMWWTEHDKIRQSQVWKIFDRVLRRPQNDSKCTSCIIMHVNECPCFELLLVLRLHNAKSLRLHEFFHSASNFQCLEWRSCQLQARRPCDHSASKAACASQPIAEEGEGSLKKNAWKKSGNKTVHSRENVITRVTVIIQNKCSCSNWHTEIEDCTGFHFDV